MATLDLLGLKPDGSHLTPDLCRGRGMGYCTRCDRCLTCCSITPGKDCYVTVVRLARIPLSKKGKDRFNHVLSVVEKARIPIPGNCLVQIKTDIARRLSYGEVLRRNNLEVPQ